MKGTRMKSLKTTSKILLVVAALSLTAAGCERRAGDQSGAGGTSGSSSGSMGSGSSGTSGAGTSGSSGSGTSGSSGTSK
jgi:hypothetical protein